MILTGGIILGLALAVARRGDLRRIADTRVRWWLLIVVAALLRIIAVTAYVPRGWDGPIYAASLWLLVAVALRNLALPSASVVATSIALNAIVITANGGAMPVSSEALSVASAFPAHFDQLHVELTVDSALPTLADVVPVPLLRGIDLPVGRVYSLGDFLLAGGLMTFILRKSATRAEAGRPPDARTAAT